MKGSLSDRRFVVTGAAKGLGAVVAERFIAEGAHGVGLDLSYATGTADQLRSELAAGPAQLHCDVADAASVAAAFELIEQVLGGVDILVNCAGIVIRTPWHGTTVEDWDRVMAVNVRGSFLCLAAAARIMIDQQLPGRMVNISSLAARTGGQAAAVSYTTSKAAVIGLTRSMAMELAQHDILVNCLAPGPMETDMIREWTQETRDIFIRESPIHRIMGPEVAAELILYLVSDGNVMITGQTIDINGGKFLS